MSADLHARLTTAVTDRLAKTEGGLRVEAEDLHMSAIAEAEGLKRERDEALAEVERLKWELGRWTSGQRWLRMPVVTAVPDGLQTAATLARSIGTEGGEELDALLARASQAMKALHDAASWLIADRDAMRAVIEAAKAWAANVKAWGPPLRKVPGSIAGAEELLAAVDALPTPTEVP
jgi:hypothetical protein